MWVVNMTQKKFFICMKYTYVQWLHNKLAILSWAEMPILIGMIYKVDGHDFQIYKVGVHFSMY